MELFLADHEITFPADESEFFPEQEVAEVLASTWKEKRAKIAKLQKARRFDRAKELLRSFSVEIEELKKKTKCNRRHQVGHWARVTKNGIPLPTRRHQRLHSPSPGEQPRFCCFGLGVWEDHHW